jgi:hypothetical protein
MPESPPDQAERDGRNWGLRLTNGTSVPVARNRVADIRARGWIEATDNPGCRTGHRSGMPT